VAVVGEAIVLVRPLTTGFAREVIAETDKAMREAGRHGAQAYREGNRGPMRAAGAAGARDAAAGAEAEAGAARRAGAAHGRAFRLGWGAAAVAAGTVGVAAVKMAANFQAQTNLLVTAAGEAPEALAGIRKGILDIAGQTGVAWHQLSEGAYNLGKAGYHGADALVVLKAAAQGAREEGADLATVTGAMTSVMATYHLKASDSVRVMNALKTGAGEAKTTMQDFAGSLSTVLPLASIAHVGFDQIAGALATLTQHGTSAQQATQDMHALLVSLTGGSHAASSAMQQMGIDVTDLQKNVGKRGLTGSVELVVDAITKHMGPGGLVLQDAFKKSKSAAADAQIMLSKMPGPVAEIAKRFADGSITSKEWMGTIRKLPVDQANLARQFAVVESRSRGFNDRLRAGDPAAKTFQAALQSVLGTQNAANAALMLSGENMQGFRDRTERVGKSLRDNSKDVEGWASTQKLFNVQLSAFIQRVEGVGIKLGTALIPMLLGAAKGIGDFASTVAHAIPVGTIMGVLRPVGDEIGRFASGVGRLMKDLAPVAGMIVAAFGGAVLLAVRGLGEALGFVGDLLRRYHGWIAPLAAGILVAAAAFGAWRLAVLAWNAAGRAFEAVQKAIKVAMEANIWVKVALLVIALGTALVYAYKHSATFRRVVHEALHAVGQAASAVGHFFVGMWHGIRDALNAVVGLVGGVVDGIVGVWHGLVHGFEAVGEAVVGFLRRWWKLLLVVCTLGVAFIPLVVLKYWRQIYAFEVAVGRAIVGAAVATWHAVWGVVKAVGEAIWSAAVTVWNAVYGAVAGPVRAVWSVVSFVLGLVLKLWRWEWDTALAIVTGAWKLISDGVSGAAGFLWKNIIKPFIDLVTGAWSGFWGGLQSVASTIFGAISSAISDTLGGIQSAFSTAVDAIRTVWDQIKGYVADPVNVVIDVYNKGIVPVWNWVAGVVDLPKAPTFGPVKFEQGGIRLPEQATIAPGRGRGLVQWAEQGTGGESFIPLAPAKRERSLAIWAQTGRLLGAFEGGGILGSIGDALSGLASGTVTVLGKAVSFARGKVADALAAMFGPVRALIADALGGKGWAGSLGRLITRPIDSLIDFVRGRTVDAAKVPGGIGPQTARWSDLAYVMLSVLHQQAALPGWLRRIQLESDGNPFALNRDDINWQRGTPSVGLAQVIGPTFRAYAGPYVHRGPFLYGVSTDAMANMFSGASYATARYGSVAAVDPLVHPGGYDFGGPLPPGLNLAWNGTGRPENVRSAGQEDALLAELHAIRVVLDGGSARPVVHQEAHYHGSDYRRSEWEARRDLVNALAGLV
jgi:SLT domain-containing protein